MKQIGIITWHYFHNYGGVLQAYALQKYLTMKENNVKIINYKGNQKSWKSIISSMVYSSCFLSKVLGRERNYKFNKFIKENLNLTHLYNNQNIKKLNERQFDIFFVGSDQVWSPTLLDTAYLLDFVGDNNKKCSYASSSVISTDDNKLIDVYKQHLTKFRKISVREQKSKENIEKYIGQKVEVVLDPTLLLNDRDYDKIIDSRKVPKGDYILCYFLGNRPFYKDVVDSLNVNGLEVYSVLGNGEGFAPYNRLSDLSPKEFLGVVKNCKLFITDSFHGVAFSIIFKRNFFVLERFAGDSNINQNPRVEHILNILQLQDRKIAEVEKCYNSNTINYNQVYERLNSYRKLSYKFIDDCLLNRE